MENDRRKKVRRESDRESVIHWRVCRLEEDIKEISDKLGRFNTMLVSNLVAVIMLLIAVVFNIFKP